MSVRHVIPLAAVLLLGVSAVGTNANINLELRPVSFAYETCDTVEIGLYAVSDDDTDQVVLGMQVIFIWDPTHLELLDVDNNGPTNWFLSGFFDDSELDGLNNTFDDGDAYYQAAASFGDLPIATPEGLLVTTIQFRALAETLGTEIRILPDVRGVVSTIVFGDLGQDVTGTFGFASISINPAVDLTDYWSFVACYSGPGSTSPVSNCRCFDSDEDGDVDLADYAWFAATFTGSGM